MFPTKQGIATFTSYLRPMPKSKEMKVNVKSISLQLLLSVLLVVVMSSCLFLKTSDLQTAASKENANIATAQDLMAKMGQAHGMENWTTFDSYTATLTDEFFGFIGKKGNPFQEDKVEIAVSYIPNSYDGQLEILSGEGKNTVWGMQSWKTYEKNTEGEIEFLENEDAFFWIPTYQYFLEFPLRIQKADAMAYAGKQTINGINCEGVLVSWRKVQPQKDVDQYLIWLDEKTHRIVKIDYTIRDQFKFLIGILWFSDYREFGGVLLPTRMEGESNLKKKGNLHEIELLDFQINKVKKESLRPDNSLPVMGDDKIE